jgi:fumarate reductase subunit D
MRITGGERAMAALGYLAILFILPVKLRRDSMFVQFHARQGGVLFGLWVALVLLVLIVAFFLPIGIQNYAIGVVLLVTVVYVLMAVVGLLKVLLGERYRMPVVADVALLLRL